MGSVNVNEDVLTKIEARVIYTTAPADYDYGTSHRDKDPIYFLSPVGNEMQAVHRIVIYDSDNTSATRADGLAWSQIDRYRSGLYPAGVDRRLGQR